MSFLYQTVPVLIVLSGTVVLVVATILFITKESNSISYMCVIGGCLMVIGEILWLTLLLVYDAIESSGVYISIGFSSIIIPLICFIPILIGIYLFKQ